MGALSDVAQHVSAALQEPAVRIRVAQALKSRSSGSEIDLQDCGPGTIAADIFAAGEREGFSGAQTLCSRLKGYSGAVLYMDPQRAQRWSPSVSPVVVAVADPSRARVRPFKAYLTPLHAITLPVDGSFVGPILAVLPYRHHSRLREPAPHASAYTVENVSKAPVTSTPQP